MICIFSGPTKLLDPTRKIVLPPTGPDSPGRTDAGVKPVWEEAGMVEARVRAVLGPDACEHNPGVCYRKDGIRRTPMRSETPKERHERRIPAATNMEPKVAHRLYSFNPAMDLFVDEPLQAVPTGGTTVAPADCFVSERLGGIDLSWFPEGFSFGNGVTTNSWVPLTNPATGERTDVLLSWCVLSPTAAVAHKTSAVVRAGLRDIFE